MSVDIYHSALHNILEERRSELQRLFRFKEVLVLGPSVTHKLKDTPPRKQPPLFCKRKATSIPHGCICVKLSIWLTAQPHRVVGREVVGVYSPGISMAGLVK
jgi:hypothetical protein